jgi:uncharacterized delta-60 repeat protein
MPYAAIDRAVLCVLSVALLGLAVSASPAGATPGALDPSFGTGGSVVTTINGYQDLRTSALVAQPDAKLVVGGTANPSGSAGISDFALARYTADGRLDSQFGQGGLAVTNFGARGAGVLSALVRQPDGKLVAAGSLLPASDPVQFLIVRYRVDGSLDPTFGQAGAATVQPGSSSRAFSIALRPDGKIVVAGVATVGSGSNSDDQVALAQLRPDGTPDPSFGSGGATTTPIGEEVATQTVNGTATRSGHTASVGGVLLQPDGRIVVAGSASLSGAPGFALVRFNPDGSLDSPFGTNGVALTQAGARSSTASSLALQPDGKLVTAGSASSATSLDLALARYEPNGSLDPVFGSGGTVVASTPGSFSGALALLRELDGRLNTAGFGGLMRPGVSFSTGFAIQRFKSGGQLDRGFGTAGQAFTPLGTGQAAAAQGLVLQPGGKLVVAGSADTDPGPAPGETRMGFALARYDAAEPVLDLEISRRALSRSLVSRRLPLRIRANERARVLVTVTVKLARRGAKIGKRAPRLLTIARHATRLSGRSRRTLNLTVRKRARRLLPNRLRIPITVTMTAKDPAGNKSALHIRKTARVP